MPDHIHLLWLGVSDHSDQLLACRHFRKHLNDVLARSQATTQKQAHDHVLKEQEREKDAFETVAEYIIRNPERAGLVPSDRFHEYPFTGTLVPGYPEFRNPWPPEFWDRFWRVYAYLRQSGCTRMVPEVGADGPARNGILASSATE
jgi:hypothetical protein